MSTAWDSRPNAQIININNTNLHLFIKKYISFSVNTTTETEKRIKYFIASDSIQFVSLPWR